MLFQDFSEESSVWSYAADRFLTEEESQKINHLLAEFLLSWSSHGKKLQCDGAFLFNSLLVLVVDSQSVSASGCSIDSSIHFVKSLEMELNVSFFNRLRLLAKKGDQLKFVQFNDSDQHVSWSTFDLSYTRLSDIRKYWPLSD